jgi:hypothetical protein
VRRGQQFDALRGVYARYLAYVPTSGDRIEAFDVLDATRTEPLAIRNMRLPAGFATGRRLAVRQPLSGCTN